LKPSLSKRGRPCLDGANPIRRAWPNIEPVSSTRETLPTSALDYHRPTGTAIEILPYVVGGGVNQTDQQVYPYRDSTPDSFGAHVSQDPQPPESPPFTVHDSGRLDKLIEEDKFDTKEDKRKKLVFYEQAPTVFSFIHSSITDDCRNSLGDIAFYAEVRDSKEPSPYDLLMCILHLFSGSASYTCKVFKLDKKVEGLYALHMKHDETVASYLDRFDNYTKTARSLVGSTTSEFQEYRIAIRFVLTLNSKFDCVKQMIQTDDKKGIKLTPVLKTLQGMAAFVKAFQLAPSANSSKHDHPETAFIVSQPSPAPSAEQDTKQETVLKITTPTKQQSFRSNKRKASPERGSERSNHDRPNHDQGSPERHQCF
jgi:hypothetical protein